MSAEWSKYLPLNSTYDPGTYDDAAEKAAALRARVGEVYASRWGAYERARVWECRPTGDFVLAGCFEGLEVDRWDGHGPNQTLRGRLRYAGAILIRTADGEFCTAGIATPPAKVQSVPCQVCKGARFTCRACGGTGTIHRDIKPPRPTPAPFVPLVDEWDLLPDA